MHERRIVLGLIGLVLLGGVLTFLYGLLGGPAW